MSSTVASVTGTTASSSAGGGNLLMMMPLQQQQQRRRKKRMGTAGDDSLTTGPPPHHHEATTSGRTTTTTQQKYRSRRVWTSRAIFLLFGLGVVGALLGWGGHYLLTQSEESLAKQQFAAIADRALHAARAIAVRKRLGAKSLATSAAYAFPNAASWPFVMLPGFPAIAQSVMETAEARTMGLAPLVRPEQIPEFVDFVHRNAFASPSDILPYQTWVTGFNSKFERYNETTGFTDWDSAYNGTVWPFSMHSSGTPILLLNLYSMELFGSVIDEMMNCALARTETDALDMAQCAIISDIEHLFLRDGSQSGPSSFIMQPIYPANDPNVLAGLITSTVNWTAVLEDLFTSEVSGVDCVLQTDTQAFTYHVEKGVTLELGVGDLHDIDFNEFGKSAVVSSPQLFNGSSAVYTLTLYPSGGFFEVYATRNPTIALVGALCIVVFTSALFFLYDYFVRQEFQHKREILKAKRAFMRFVSHEVRTPLNTVVMGAQLVNDDMALYSKTAAAAEKGPEDEQLQERLTNWSNLNGDILTNAQSAVDVLSDLLNYDKIESGTLSLELTIVPIWTLVQRTADEFTLSTRAKNIALSVDFGALLEHEQTTIVFHKEETAFENGDDEDGGNMRNKTDGTEDTYFDNNHATSNDVETGNPQHPLGLLELPTLVKEQRVIGDNMRIAQVLRNFLSNAIKFTPEGGHVKVAASWVRGDSSSMNRKRNFTLHNGEEVSFAHNGYVHISVKDSGAGLSGDQVAKVFGEGVQFNVNELQAGQGSGLGLYIAQGIARKHEGRLTVESDGLGHGTTFSVILPLYHVPDPELPESLLRTRSFREEFAKPPLQVPPVPPPTLVPETTRDVVEAQHVTGDEENQIVTTATGDDDEESCQIVTTTGDVVANQTANQSERGDADENKVAAADAAATLAPPPPPAVEPLPADEPTAFRILVVDDTPMNRKLLMRMLKNKGHSCDGAEDGVVAVRRVTEALAKGEVYDTILLDYEMPEMNGPTAAREIRKMGCDTFIVGVTGNILAEDVAYFKAQGANHVLPKPLDMTALEDLWMEHAIAATAP